MKKVKRYPSYKESGIEWIGNIPESWEVKPLYVLFSELKNKNLGNLETNVLSLSYGNIVSRNVETNMGLLPESFETYNIVNEGNIVLRLTDLQNDKKSLRCGYVKCKGIITSAYTTLQKKREELNSYFYYFLLHSYDISKVFYNLGAGVRQSMSFSDLKRMPLLVLSLAEQTQIVEFLEEKIADIDSLITDKEKLIKLLEEKRKAIIIEAVTKGLNPKAKMKDSGLEWLGEIPNHWNISKVKYELNNLDYKRIPLSSEERGKMTKKLFDYYGASGIIDKVDNYLFDETLILIGEDGANLYSRSTPLAFLAKGKYWVNNHAHILKPKKGDINYLVNLLESIDYTIYISGSAQPKLTQDALGNIAIPLPPTDEQKIIGKFVESVLTEHNEAITTIREQIEKLKEYRQSLIYEAVTGKIDVREYKKVLS